MIKTLTAAVVTAGLALGSATTDARADNDLAKGLVLGAIAGATLAFFASRHLGDNDRNDRDYSRNDDWDHDRYGTRQTYGSRHDDRVSTRVYRRNRDVYAEGGHVVPPFKPR
ncbi:MAG: hypothetical protein ACPGGK_17210, partial [Pikeienuella sp.]